MGNAAKDWQGAQVGALRVLYRAGTRNRNPLWRCRCACGAIVSRTACNLAAAGPYTSCGCQHAAKTSAQHAARKKPGGTFDTPGMRRAHGSWRSMMKRCYREDHDAFPYYGARGIRVADRWHDVAAFLADMGERPRGTSLDRLDNTADYGPGNCRWSTASTQARNRSTTRLTAPVVRNLRAAAAAGLTARQARDAHAPGVNVATVRSAIRGATWQDI